MATVREMTTIEETGERKIGIEPFELADIATRSHSTIRVWVPGFWSSVITIYVTRDFNWNKWKKSGSDEPEYLHFWTFTINHSSGGRDQKDIADDIDAEEWFARGLTEAVALARRLRGLEAQLEQLFVADRALRDAVEQEEKAKAQALINADVALTSAQADELMKNAESAARAAHDAGGYAYRTYSCSIMARRRGESECKVAATVKRRDGVSRWYDRNRSSIAKSKVNALLCEYAANGACVSTAFLEH